MALTAKFISDFSRFFADVQKATGMLGNMQTEADKVGTSLDWKGPLTAMAGAVGVAFSVNAVKNFALGVIDAAGDIGDMSEKLGISAEAVQRFGYAADQSGASITTVDSAIKKMNDNLAGGSDSTVAALSAAGLRFEDIRRMAPEKAFTAIGDAVAGIEDPMLRAQVATDLFGRAGQELIPTFLAGIRKVGEETAVMSDETVERLKAAQDQWSKFSNAVTVYGGEAIGAIGKFGEAWQRNSRFLAEAANPLTAIPKGLKDLELTSDAAAHASFTLGQQIATVTPPLQNFSDRALKPVALDAKQVDAAIGYMNATLARVPGPTKEATAAAKEAAKELANWAREGERLAVLHYRMGEAAVAASQNVGGFTIRMSEAVIINRDFSTTLTDSTIKADSFGHVLTSNVLPSLQGIGGATHQAGLAAKDTASKQDILNSRMNDITGILGGIQTKWAQTATVAAKAIQGITNDLISGNWVGAITKATVALSGFIGSLFGASEESKKVSPMRDEFFRLQGGLERLNPRVQELEGNLESVQAVFDAKTVQQYDAAIANLNRILAQDTTAFNRATDAAEDYAHALKAIPKNVGTFAGGGGGDVPGFARGTGGQFVDFGAGTLAMLHGKEAIVPESAVRTAGGGGAAPGGVTININAAGAFFDTPGDLQRLADKVNDALTAKYGLSHRLHAA